MGGLSLIAWFHSLGSSILAGSCHPCQDTARSGFGTCKRVKYISARQRLEDAQLDEAMKTQSIAILQGDSPPPSRFKALGTISCGFQPHTLTVF